MESDPILLKPYDPCLGEVVAVRLLSDSIQISIVLSAGVLPHVGVRRLFGEGVSLSYSYDLTGLLVIDLPLSSLCLALAQYYGMDIDVCNIGTSRRKYRFFVTSDEK